MLPPSATVWPLVTELNVMVRVPAGAVVEVDARAEGKLVDAISVTAPLMLNGEIDSTILPSRYALKPPSGPPPVKPAAASSSVLNGSALLVSAAMTCSASAFSGSTFASVASTDRGTSISSDRRTVRPPSKATISPSGRIMSTLAPSASSTRSPAWTISPDLSMRVWPSAAIALTTPCTSTICP